MLCSWGRRGVPSPNGPPPHGHNILSIFTFLVFPTLSHILNCCFFDPLKFYPSYFLTRVYEVYHELDYIVMYFFDSPIWLYTHGPRQGPYIYILLFFVHVSVVVIVVRRPCVV